MNLNCIQLDFQVLNLQLYTIWYQYQLFKNKSLDLDIQDSCYFPTGHFQVIFCQQTFFNQQKTHHSSNSHVTSQDSDVTMLLNHAAGEGWTLQGWIFGALKKHNKLEGDTTVVEVCLTMCWNAFNFYPFFIIEKNDWKSFVSDWRSCLENNYIQMFSTSWHFLRGIIFIQLKSLPSIQVLQSRRQSQVQSYPKPPSEV